MQFDAYNEMRLDLQNDKIIYTNRSSNVYFINYYGQKAEYRKKGHKNNVRFVGRRGFTLFIDRWNYVRRKTKLQPNENRSSFTAVRLNRGYGFRSTAQ